MDVVILWVVGLAICVGVLVWLAVAFVRVLRGAVRRAGDLGEDTDPGSSRPDAGVR